MELTSANKISYKIYKELSKGHRVAPRARNKTRAGGAQARDYRGCLPHQGEERVESRILHVRVLVAGLGSPCRRVDYVLCPAPRSFAAAWYRSDFSRVFWISSKCFNLTPPKFSKF